MLSHQIDGFLCAWLSGTTISRFGDYSWVWIADMVLALVTALFCLPVREARLVARGTPPATPRSRRAFR